jgi:hypothetical protein
MPKIITARDEILEYQNKFQSIIMNNADQRIRERVTHPAATGEYDISYEEINKFWYASKIIDQEHKVKRYWNVFGFYEVLPSRKPLTIIGEINFPFSGKDGRVAGLFFKNEDNTIFVGHNGKITIRGFENGKAGFWNHYQGPDIRIGGDRIAVIGSLNDNNFYNHVVNFIKEIRRIKSIIR